MTLFLGPDQEDVYVYETNAAMDAYSYGGEWESVRVVEETFDVKSHGPQTLPLKFTRHGAVVYEHAPSNRAIAIRTVWSEPGTAPYGASLRAMRARSVDEFRDAMRHWAVPAVNQVYADVTGEIAWITAGLTPVRRNWDGLLPVPGDGRYEWDGFLDPGVLPMQRNPACGFVASANAMNLPRDWSHADHPMGYEWDDPSRARRIEECLRGRTGHSLASSRAMQNDVVSIPARRLCGLLEHVDTGDEETKRALALLREWDASIAVESGVAALFEVWWSQHLRPAVIERLVPNAAARALIAPPDVESVLQAIEQPGPLLEGRDELLTSTLARAYRDCVTRMGPNPASWAWGWLHTLHLRHRVLALDPQRPPVEVGPLPLGGSESTLAKATYRASDFGVTMGAALRVVIDVGAWDNSVWINSPGQSGDPRSPHFADMAPLWARGEYVPMLYSVEAVAEATVRVIRLAGT